MSRDGTTGGASDATTADDAATKFTMTSPETGVSLKHPVSLVSGATSEPASSAVYLGAKFGGVDITASSVGVPFIESAKSHVWNGAVNGDSARAISEMAHSFVIMVLRRGIGMEAYCD